jgi:hypothetical protein
MPEVKDIVKAEYGSTVDEALETINNNNTWVFTADELLNKMSLEGSKTYLSDILLWLWRTDKIDRLKFGKHYYYGTFEATEEARKVLFRKK